MIGAGRLLKKCPPATDQFLGGDRRVYANVHGAVSFVRQGVNECAAAVGVGNRGRQVNRFAGLPVVGQQIAVAVGVLSLKLYRPWSSVSTLVPMNLKSRGLVDLTTRRPKRGSTGSDILRIPSAFRPPRRRH